MIETVKNAWKIPELRKKLTFVLFAIIIYRLGFAIYVPFVDTVTLANQFASLNSGNLLGYFNTLSGGGVRAGFEGGQMPLVRRLPKRGFNNIFAKNYAEVNVCQLNALENGTEVTFETLVACGLVGKNYDGVRILGKGELEKKLTVKVAGVTASAKEKIVAAGGEVI